MKKVAKSKPSKAPKLAPSRAKVKIEAEEPQVSEEPTEADLAAAEAEVKEAVNGTPTVENNGLGNFGRWAQA